MDTLNGNPSDDSGVLLRRLVVVVGKAAVLNGNDMDDKVLGDATWPAAIAVAGNAAVGDGMVVMGAM